MLIYYDHVGSYLVIDTRQIRREQVIATHPRNEQVRVSLWYLHVKQLVSQAAEVRTLQRLGQKIRQHLQSR